MSNDIIIGMAVVIAEQKRKIERLEDSNQCLRIGSDKIMLENDQLKARIEELEGETSSLKCLKCLAKNELAIKVDQLKDKNTALEARAEELEVKEEGHEWAHNKYKDRLKALEEENKKLKKTVSDYATGKIDMFVKKDYCAKCEQLIGEGTTTNPPTRRLRGEVTDSKIRDIIRGMDENNENEGIETRTSSLYFPR
jgi:chromosome segregation ATPase